MTVPAATLPASWYVKDAGYEVERQSIFASSWLLIGHVGDVPDPGSRVVVTMAGVSMIVVRGDDGELRGFHNVCPHRAGPLAVEGTSFAPSLVCRYHGWSFNLDGSLRQARDFGEPGPDPDSCGLSPISVSVWRGFIWCHLAPDPPVLSSDLGGFADAARDSEIEAFVPAGEWSHEISCNWKVYAENYLEGYHLPLVHPALTREVQPSKYRVEVGDRWCRHDVPTRQGAVNAGCWLWRWPNVALNLYPDSMNVERFIPTGPHSTLVSYRYFTRTGDLDDAVVAMSRSILEEDAVICEAVQRNLESGVYHRGMLSPKHEAGVAAFQRLIGLAWGEQ